MVGSVTTIKKEDIVAGLRSLGLASGEGVVVHSSLKSFGRVDGGAETVIAALMQVIMAEGTLLMPSFNHGGAFADGAQGYFDPRVIIERSAWVIKRGLLIEGDL